MSQIRDNIKDAMKEAMRAHEKQRLSAIRMIMAEFKKVEVDERIELDESRVLAILDKMVKQRKDSLNQYLEAGRQDLADTESFELAVLQGFLPTPLTDAEVNALIQQALTNTNASSMQDMGKVMAAIKPQIQGRADVSAVSQQVRQLLTQQTSS